MKPYKIAVQRARKLMQIYIKHIPKDIRPILAIDHTSSPRPDAVTLQERTIEHQATDIPGNRPLTLGQGYSTIAWVPESEGSWALPLRHERITSWESPIDKAVWQLRQVSQYLPSRPIVLIDSEYGCAPFVLKTAGIQADKLMRLRSNLCLWGAPPLSDYSDRPISRKSLPLRLLFQPILQHYPHSGSLFCARSLPPTSTVYGVLPTDISTVNLTVASLSGACSLLIKLDSFD